MKFTEDQKTFWNQNSYILIKDLFKNEIDEITNWVQEIKSWKDDSSKWISSYEMDDSSKLSRRENVIPYHLGLANLLAGDKMINLINELLGVPTYLYKERINFKLPGGGPHAAHQDGVAYEYGGKHRFDAETIPYISILISVDKATSENGCLEIVPNWNMDNLDILPMEAPIPEKPYYTKMKQSVEDKLEWKQIPTDPGDMLIFTERLPHRSKPNFSNNTRTILYGVYNPASEGAKREQYYDMKKENPNDARYLVGNPHSLTE